MLLDMGLHFLSPLCSAGRFNRGSVPALPYTRFSSNLICDRTIYCPSSSTWESCCSSANDACNLISTFVCSPTCGLTIPSFSPNNGIEPSTHSSDVGSSQSNTSFVTFAHIMAGNHTASHTHFYRTFRDRDHWWPYDDRQENIHFLRIFWTIDEIKHSSRAHTGRHF